MGGQSDSRLYALSTVDTEREAIKWAEARVVRVRDVLTGGPLVHDKLNGRGGRLHHFGCLGAPTAPK